MPADDQTQVTQEQTLPSDPIIAVVGAGAVGGYYGARLVQSGRQVHFLLRSDYQVVHERGWRIRSRDGDFDLPATSVHAHQTVSTMPPADLVIVAAKATANPDLPALIGPLLHQDSAILTLQNGLGNEAFLASYFGARRILGGLVFACINRTAPGEIHHMDHGQIHLGEYQRPASARLRQIGAWFSSAKVPITILDSLAAGRWEKLVWNIPFNGLGAALDLSTDRLVNQPDGLLLVRALMAEVIASARTQGIMLDDDLIDQKIEQTRSMGTYQSSMQIDRQMGRPMEIDAIIGQALRAASSQGAVPVRIEMLYQMLRAMEAREV